MPLSLFVEKIKEIFDLSTISIQIPSKLVLLLPPRSTFGKLLTYGFQNVLPFQWVTMGNLFSAMNVLGHHAEFYFVRLYRKKRINKVLPADTTNGILLWTMKIICTAKEFLQPEISIVLYLSDQVSIANWTREMLKKTRIKSRTTYQQSL